MRRPLLLSLLLAAACAPQAVVKPSAELAVTKVVLYQNGVGYFERRGRLDGEALELRVRPDQINDVLKSLSVLDLSGGVASSVSLPVERSGDEVAAQLPAQVRHASGIQGLLAVLRGAEVEVEADDGTHAGRVVGVEQAPGKDADGKPIVAPTLTLMAGEDRLVTVPVAKIRRVTIADKALSVGLQRSLDISKGEGAWKPVSLTVRLAGDGTHDLLVSYIHEVPIWRPAYRAWVEKGKGVHLQGWAIVDNVSGEAWKDVNLTLVVGSPLSFRYNLHTPHRVTRPDLSPRLPQVADAPPEPDAGYEAAEAEAPPPAPSPEPEMAKKDMAAESKPAERRMKKMPPAPPRAGPAPRAHGAYDDGDARGGEAQRRAEEQARRDAMMRSAQALVQGKEVGALYAYEATAPVTVPDRSAALINIVSRKVDGEDVFLFREPQSGQAPFRAVLLRNGKQSALEAGPITLYVDGTFAGEGFIGRVGRDETAFVPYARESGFSLNLEHEQKVDQLHLVRIVDGRITLQGKRLYTRTLKLESNRDEPSLAYVKLPLTGGTELVEAPKQIVKSGAEVFVPVQVPAKGKGLAKMVEATPIHLVEMGLNDNVASAFRYYLQNAKPEEAIAGPIRQLLALYEERTRIQEDSRNLERQRDILDQEQNRIQGNLDALPPGPVAADLRKKLVGHLEVAAKKAAEVAKRLVENQVKLAALQEQERVLLRQIELK